MKEKRNIPTAPNLLSEDIHILGARLTQSTGAGSFALFVQNDVTKQKLAYSKIATNRLPGTTPNGFVGSTRTLLLVAKEATENWHKPDADKGCKTDLYLW